LPPATILARLTVVSLAAVAGCHDAQQWP
jgi:hypothetical protein